MSDESKLERMTATVDQLSDTVHVVYRLADSDTDGLDTLDEEGISTWGDDDIIDCALETAHFPLTHYNRKLVELIFA